MILESVITCPQCRLAKAETMPTDSCQFFYRCSGCGTMLKPKTRRLLRVLFLRVGALPADAVGRRQRLLLRLSALLPG